MLIEIVSDVKDLTKGKKYEVVNHIFCLDRKSVVDDIGYYLVVESKDFKEVI